MLTIADASTVDLNSPTTWAVLAAAVFVALAVLIRGAYRAPVQEAEPSRLDELDQVQSGLERLQGFLCSYDSCDEPPVAHVHAGFDYWPMCAGHGAPFLSADLRDGVK